MGNKEGSKDGSSLLVTHESFPFDKMVPGMLESEMIEDDPVKIVNEAIKDKVMIKSFPYHPMSNRLKP